MTAYPVKDLVSGWRLAPDAPLPAAAFTQALLTAALIDEITAAPPLGLAVATTTTIGMLARATADGAAGLVGRPLTQYGPGSVVGAALQLGLAQPGYLPVALTATLGPQPGYPAAFTPSDLGVIELHRTPTILSGRVASRTAGALAGATVTLDGMWATLADLGNPTPSAPNIVALNSPLYSARDTSATIASQNLTLAPPAEAKSLLAPGNPGDLTIRLSDWVGLSTGSILGFDPRNSERAEHIAVTAITPLGLGAAFPAIIALAFPMARPHASAATVSRMISAPSGTTNALSRAGQPGDLSLFPTAMTGLDASMNAVVVSGGGADEYHTAGLVTGISNGAGFMRLPAIHRLAQLRLRVHHPSQASDLLIDIMLPFGADTLTRDLVFA